jgi:uncharacterized protein (TIGR02145 family)
MKILRIFLLFALAIQFSCKEEVLPTVETLAPEILGATRATLKGNLIDPGSSEVSSMGFCWSLHPGPTVGDSIIPHLAGTGDFSKEFEIVPDSTYYVKAYATNRTGTAYGNEVTVTTIGTYSGTMTDARDGRVYRWVRIGHQYWMTENLAYLPAVFPPAEGGYQESFYYVQGYVGSNKEEAKATEDFRLYGVLYNWKATQSACPDGWHLPSDAEWMDLEDNLGMSSTDLEASGYRLSGNLGRRLKSAANWLEGGNGENEYGFNVQPGGSRNSNGEFGGRGSRANYRTGSAGGSTNNFNRSFSNDNDGINRGTAVHNLGLSVRCIRN